MDNRKDQINDLSYYLSTLDSTTSPLALDLYTRITNLDKILSEHEIYLSEKGPFIEVTNDNGILEYKPSPIIDSYTHTITIYKATVCDLIKILDSHTPKSKPLPRPTFKKAISAFIIIASALFAYWL